jgi:hypothetical protein
MQPYQTISIIRHKKTMISIPFLMAMLMEHQQYP